jgi:hypothetical protein
MVVSVSFEGCASFDGSDGIGGERSTGTTGADRKAAIDGSSFSGSATTPFWELFTIMLMGHAAGPVVGVPLLLWGNNVFFISSRNEPSLDFPLPNP